jgi:hypothetical protein
MCSYEGNGGEQRIAQGVNKEMSNIDKECYLQLLAVRRFYNKRDNQSKKITIYQAGSGIT